MYVSMYVCDCKGWCFAALLLRIDVYLRDEESRRQPSDAVPASNRGAAILRCGLHEEGSPGRINKASLVRRIGGGGRPRVRVALRHSSETWLKQSEVHAGTWGGYATHQFLCGEVAPFLFDTVLYLPTGSTWLPSFGHFGVPQLCRGLAVPGLFALLRLVAGSQWMRPRRYFLLLVLWLGLGRVAESSAGTGFSSPNACITHTTLFAFILLSFLPKL